MVAGGFQKVEGGALLDLEFVKSHCWSPLSQNLVPTLISSIFNNNMFIDYLCQGFFNTKSL